MYKLIWCNFFGYYLEVWKTNFLSCKQMKQLKCKSCAQFFLLLTTLYLLWTVTRTKIFAIQFQSKPHTLGLLSKFLVVKPYISHHLSYKKLERMLQKKLLPICNNLKLIWKICIWCYVSGIPIKKTIILLCTVRWRL